MIKEVIKSISKIEALKTFVVYNTMTGKKTKNLNTNLVKTKINKYLWVKRSLIWDWVEFDIKHILNIVGYQGNLFQLVLLLKSKVN